MTQPKVMSKKPQGPIRCTQDGCSRTKYAASNSSATDGARRHTAGKKAAKANRLYLYARETLFCSHVICIALSGYLDSAALGVVVLAMSPAILLATVALSKAESEFPSHHSN